MAQATKSSEDRMKKGVGAPKKEEEHVVAVVGGREGCQLYASFRDAQKSVEQQSALMQTFPDVVSACKWLQTKCELDDEAVDQVVAKYHATEGKRAGAWADNWREEAKTYQASIVRIRDLAREKKGAILSFTVQDFKDWKAQRARTGVDRFVDGGEKGDPVVKTKRSWGASLEGFPTPVPVVVANAGKRYDTHHAAIPYSQFCREVAPQPYPFGTVRPDTVRSATKGTDGEEESDEKRQVALMLSEGVWRDSSGHKSVLLKKEGQRLSWHQVNQLRRLQTALMEIIEKGLWTHFYKAYVIGNPEYLVLERDSRLGEKEVLQFRYEVLRGWSVTEGWFEHGIKGLNFSGYP